MIQVDGTELVVYRDSKNRERVLQLEGRLEGASSLFIGRNRRKRPLLVEQGRITGIVQRSPKLAEKSNG